MGLHGLDELMSLARRHKTKRLVVAAAEDDHVLLAVKQASENGIIEPVLVGDEQKIKNLAASIEFSVSGIEIIHETEAENAAQMAVEKIRNGDADVLMKGLVSTGPLLKAVLHKEKGLRKTDILSHVALFESPYYHKLIAVTDAAMNIAPDLNEKIALVKNAVDLYHRLGEAMPKVGIVSAVENVNPKMEATLHAAIMAAMNRRGQLKDCLVDGPFALDNAISKEAAKLKKIEGEVAGDVDIILTPDINTGNVLYKAFNFLGGAISAAVIMGASVPVVLTSRADSEKSKYMSIVLAAAMD